MRARRLGAAAAWFAAALLLASWGVGGEEPPPPLLTRHVLFRTTLGTLRLELRPDAAPEHTRWFMALCQAGVYDGTFFTRVLRDLRLEGGYKITRRPPLSPALEALLKPMSKDAPRADCEYGGLRLLDPEHGESAFAIFLGARESGAGAGVLVAQVVAGYETLSRISEIRAGEEGFPKAGVGILETLVVNPTWEDESSPVYDQLIEERYARLADPRFVKRRQRQPWREVPEIAAPAGQEPAVALAALLALLGFALFRFAGHFTVRHVSALGGLALVTGVLILYLHYLARAAQEPGLALVLFFGALSAFWVLGRKRP